MRREDDELFARIEARRNDAEFMRRLQCIVDEDRDVLKRLQVGPAPRNTVSLPDVDSL